MVRCFLRAGLPVVAFDIDPRRRAEAAEGSQVSLTMVMDDRVLRVVALSEDGVLADAPSGHLYCDLSTVSPPVSKEIATAAERAHVHYLRATVAGSIGLATQRQLSVFASGDAGDVERAAPVFARSPARCPTSATRSCALPQAGAPHRRGGVCGHHRRGGDIRRQGRGGYRTVIDLLGAGPLGSRQLSLKASMLRERSFTNPPLEVDTAAKDLDLAPAAAVGVGATTPFAATARQLMTSRRAHGEGDLDIWSVIRSLEAQAAVDR